jgi:hypothetical protein
MKKAGGSSLVIMAILLILLGVILLTDIIQSIITFAGWMAIIIGAVIGVIGLWQMLSGDRSGRSY